MNSKLNNLLNNQRLLKFLLNYSIFILVGELMLMLLPRLGWGDDIPPFFKNEGVGLFWDILTSWGFVYLALIILFGSRHQRSKIWLLPLLMIVFIMLLQHINDVLSYFFIVPTESSGMLGVLDVLEGVNSFFPWIVVTILLSVLAVVRTVFLVLFVVYSFKSNQKLLKIISVLMIGQSVFPTVLTLFVTFLANAETYSDTSQILYKNVPTVFLFLVNGLLIYWFSQEQNVLDESRNSELDDKINMDLGGEK